MKAVSEPTLLTRWVQFCARSPKLVLLLTLGITAFSLMKALELKVNTNQLEMISSDSRQVKDVYRVTDMIGGAGQLTIALRGQDISLLKAAAVHLSQHLMESETARIRSAEYRLPIEFLLARAAMFMETADLAELRKRINEKIADSERRADPFFFEITPTPPVELKLNDILDKYKRVGKKQISDDFYLSGPSDLPGSMVLVQVKPNWDSNELNLTGELVQSIKKWLSDRPHQLIPYPVEASGQETTSAVQITFIEDYSAVPAESQDIIEFGFTGTYQTNFDDSYQIKESLAPVSIFAFIGVVLSLLLFFGRHVFAVILVLSGLIIGLLITFGWTALTVGELNMITSILGGILMGLGIDFGIHLIYRFREEINRASSLEEALATTLSGAGQASFISGLGTAAAFASLLTSDFKGFSQFGFLAGSGVILIGITMYVWVPAMILWVDQLKPGRASRWLGGEDPSITSTTPKTRSLPRAGLIASVSGGLALFLSGLAPNVPFEFNTRALMIEGLASVELQDEVTARFSYGSDPVAVFTPTREAALEVFEYFKARLPASSSRPEGVEPLSTVDQVVGIHSFLPPSDQQIHNAEILKKWEEELSTLDRSRLPEEVRARWDEVERALKAKPFSLSDLPERYRLPFESLASAKTENRGFLTYVYAGIDLWDGVEMRRFASDVENIPVASGTYHAAGMPILFAQLTSIILRDGQLTVLWTALLLLIILAIDLRNLSAVMIALAPLLLGVGLMLGLMSLTGAHLNLMNIVVFPIIIGYGVSHGVYFLHRVREGATPREALSSVGRAVACSTLTTLVGWAALLVAPHRGLQSMGILACIGMLSSLVVSFTLMPAVLELKRQKASRLNSQKLKTAVSIIFLVGLTGCGGAKQTYLVKTFPQKEKSEVIRVEIVVQSVDSQLREDQKGILEMWGLMTQRYLHDHRDFIPLRRQITSDQATYPSCREDLQGMFILSGSGHPDGDEIKIKLDAQLFQCEGTDPPSRLIWSAVAEGSSEADNQTLKTLRADYVSRFGQEVDAYVAPSFLVIKELLELAPYPKISAEDDVMAKIDFELE